MSEKARRVFWSWQSDLPNKTNRSLIQDALSRAVRNISKDAAAELEPVIDRDTVGRTGSPHISETIFEKIASADAFVADVTIVGRAARRPTPNPNVLVELGYALAALGQERVVQVANAACGKIELLPFDIRSRRVLAYALKTDEEPASARTALVGMLEQELRVLLSKPRTDGLLRLRVYAGRVVPMMRGWNRTRDMPMLFVSVMNTSDRPVYPSGLHFKLSGGTNAFVKADALTGMPPFYGFPDGIQPGNAAQVAVELAEVRKFAPVGIYVVDRIQRTFAGDAGELADALRESASPLPGVPVDDDGSTRPT